MRIISLFIIILGVCSCSAPGVPENFDYGKIEKNVYRNDFFKFAVDVPEGWFVQSDEMMEELSDAGADLIAGDNAQLKRNLDVAEINTAYLLTVFKHEIGATLEFNPSYLFVAENLAAAPFISNGADYLAESKNLLLQAAVEYTFPPVEQETVQLGGKEFHVMNAIMNYAGEQIHQTYFSLIENRFALSCIISYADEAQKQELESILNSIKFL